MLLTPDLPMRLRCLFVGGSLLVSVAVGLPVQAADLDQRFRSVQRLLDEISLARAVGDRSRACVAALSANDLLLDLLPELQRRRPGVDHAALQDRILRSFPRCH